MNREQCTKCPMLRICYLNDKIVRDQQGVEKHCPCYNCLVVPMCKKHSSCVDRILYATMYYANGFQPTLKAGVMP